MSAADNLNGVQFRTQVQNVSTVYDRTPAPVRREGMEWYDRVNEAVAKGVRGTSTSAWGGAGIVAAVSPSMDFDKRNIHALTELHSLQQRDWDALHAGDRSPVRGLAVSQATTDSLVKAHRIMQGEDPAAVLTAPKTYSFATNIDRPDVAGRVAIDGRAYDIATNEMRGWEQNRGISKPMYTPTGAVTAAHRRYQHFERVYREAAAAAAESDDVDLLPHQMQAATWLGGKLIERGIPTVSGRPRKKGPRREGQNYV
jgi:hypothetical protein